MVIGFGGNREPVYEPKPYLAPLLRYSDLLAKNRKFFSTHLSLSAIVRVTLFEFIEKFYGS